jgi:hypothetical protein
LNYQEKEKEKEKEKGKNFSFQSSHTFLVMQHNISRMSGTLIV